jgi:dTMP kinase
MGLFITLEGGEGAGKSTQSRFLAEHLGNSILTREPGGTPAAEWLRGFILKGHAKAWGEEAEAVLFAAARLSHMTRKILPALAKGHNVICDRFIDSTRVYQNISKEVLDALEKAATGGRLPDKTFILDIPPDLGLARALSRSGVKDRFEAEGLAFHTRLREGFLQIAKDNPQRCVVIDATQSVEKIAQDIRRYV